MSGTITLDYFRLAADKKYHIYKISGSAMDATPHTHDYFHVCYVSGGSVAFTSLYIPEGSSVSRQSYIIYAPHASNAIASKCPANLRLYNDAWVAFSCEI